MARLAALDPTCDYRREARRIRGRLADRPIERYAALRELSSRQDSIAAMRDDSPLVVPPSQAATFAALVSERLEGRVLTYSRRLELLATAQDLGVGRFEANLIIAAVQHRLAAARTSIEPAPAGSFRKALPIVGFLLVQSFILISLWGLFLR